MKRNHEVRVKLTEEEYKVIQAKAKKLGLELSAFLRLLGLNANIEVENGSH